MDTGNGTSPADLDHVLSSTDAIETSRSKLLKDLPDIGIGAEETNVHLQHDLVPGLNRSSESPSYYGFVTGGATPAASFADNIVTQTDQNVQVHLPKETISTDVEDRALAMVCQLLDLPPEEWLHRIFTTGATTSNILGLACGREFVLQEAARRQGNKISVAEDGITCSMKKTGLESIQILTTVPHSSLRKAAAILGLGRSSVVEVGLPTAKHRFDLHTLELRLSNARVASIVVVSCAEVNTGLFATDNADMRQIRQLCTKYGAWLHVDAAFGLLARVLPETEEYHAIKEGVSGLELADSITGDAHKLLNVPYDCGIFLSQHLNIGIEVFHNPNAAYLNTASTETTASIDRTIPSPLNIGLENSRRFRALPVYATLAAYGRDGYREMLERQIRLAREIARLISVSEAYDLLPEMHGEMPADVRLKEIYIIVLFRANDDDLNQTLVQRINATRKLYVSGTQWDGKPAARFAVANWQVNVERDLKLIQQVLLEISQ
ncbi:hypothetical protein LTR36_008800 [Oleoguttula mirabilis]|uniref:Tyrosine decarboxylase n=1 Tax=Oleoguttula mirabilis TaxID=1507867 RepID=A0AAV9J8Z1_9PEZI|nr:hypothetical protein LTR36_008800 [Oleoguttula mirabilis]